MNREKPETNKHEEVVLTIEGMKCFYCFTVVAGILKEFDGIKEVKVGLGKWEALVSYDSNKVKAKELKKTIIDAGYKVY